MLDLDVSNIDLKKIKKNVDPKIYKASIRASLKRVQKRGVTRSVQTMRKRYNVKRKELVGRGTNRPFIKGNSKSLKQGVVQVDYRSTPSTITRFVVGSKNKHRPAVNRSNTQRKKSKSRIKVRIFKDRQTVLQKAFIARNKGGINSLKSQGQFLLYNRKSNGKLRVPRLYAFTNYVKRPAITKRIARDMTELFKKRMRAEIKYRTSKG